MLIAGPTASTTAMRSPAPQRPTLYHLALHAPYVVIQKQGQADRQLTIKDAALFQWLAKDRWVPEFKSLRRGVHMLCILHFAPSCAPSAPCCSALGTRHWASPGLERTAQAVVRPQKIYQPWYKLEISQSRPSDHTLTLNHFTPKDYGPDAALFALSSNTHGTSPDSRFSIEV